LYKKIILVISLLFTTQALAKKQALLIGVSNYKGEASDLPGINYDIEKMKKLFIAWGFEVKVLFDNESMMTEKYLKMYSNSLNKNDIFAFYYTGHGSYALDKNGDEEDGQDESIVLSDGRSDYHYLDDELNYRLNKIRAKKFIMFDSCHSGTANKGKSKLMAKTIPSENLILFNSKGSYRGEDVNGGEFVIFSASRDYEQSRASEIGSLFTNEIYKLLSDTTSREKTFTSLQNEATVQIVNLCKRNKVNPHHPHLLTSNQKLKNVSMSQYLAVSFDNNQELATTFTESLQSQLDLLNKDKSIEKIIVSNNKESYQTGEYVKFTIDTNEVEGYLTLLYVEENDITVLYPNPKNRLGLMKGKYKFPKDFGGFQIEAYKNCKNCEQEKTTIYILLTPQPLTDIENLTQKKLLSFTKGSSTSKVISKAVRVIEEKELRGKKNNTLIGKYEFLVY